MKKALILCASHNDIGCIYALKKLGYYIIATGGVPGQMGEVLCDEYIQADYSDKELILKIAREKKVDNIVQCCNDFGVYSAAYAAEKLGLPGYDSYETTLTLHNKDRFKAFAKEYGILSPISLPFDEINTAKKYIKSTQYPVIVKPVDCSAGNGIHKASNEKEALEAIDLAFQNSRSKRIVIEPFITGKQYGFCTFLVDKKVVAYNTLNEYSIVNSYRVDMVTHPCDIFDRVKDVLTEQIEKIANILSLKDGIFHLQFIYDGNSPQIIEVMRRTMGNRHFVAANALTGVDWEYWETRAKCGMSCHDFPKNWQEGYYACKVILAEKNGKIERIEGLSIYDKYIFAQYNLREVGDKITCYYAQPVRILYLQFSTREEMESVLVQNYRNDFVKVS